MAYLDDQGLSFLIDKFQNNILHSHIYDNISIENAQYIGLFKLKFTTITTPWVIKYQIETQSLSSPNSKQVADVTFGGIGNKISYYETQNIIYDLAKAKIKNNIIFSNKNENIHYIGIQSNDSLVNQKIIINIKYISNCNISIFKTPLLIDIAKYQIYISNFSKNGNYNENTIAKAELSQVALSGDYNDLINKPTLLNVIQNEEKEEIVFFTQ